MSIGLKIFFGLILAMLFIKLFGDYVNNLCTERALLKALLLEKIKRDIRWNEIEYDNNTIIYYASTGKKVKLVKMRWMGFGIRLNPRLYDINEKTYDTDTQADLVYDIERLKDLQQEVIQDVNVPLSYMGEYYDLQLHIRHVIDKLEENKE